MFAEEYVVAVNYNGLGPLSSVAKKESNFTKEVLPLRQGLAGENKHRELKDRAKRSNTINIEKQEPDMVNMSVAIQFILRNGFPEDDELTS
ncbi:hypothetical protein OQA88_13195 [Cercophora sp. LCS_1]